eukprot:gene32399-39179_t
MNNESKSELDAVEVELKALGDDADRLKRPIPPPPPPSKRSSLKATALDTPEKPTAFADSDTKEIATSEVRAVAEEVGRPEPPLPHVSPKISSVNTRPKNEENSGIGDINPVNLDRTASIQTDAGSSASATRRMSTNPFDYDAYESPSPTPSISVSSQSMDEASNFVMNPLNRKPSASGASLSTGSSSVSMKRSSVHLINPDIGKAPHEISIPSTEKSPRIKPPKGAVFIDPTIMGTGQPDNPIYHKNLYSELWLVVFVVGIIVQFSLLLVVGYDPLPVGSFVLIILLLLSSVSLVVFSRLHVKKSSLSKSRNIALRNGECSPDDEADEVSDIAIYALGAASVLLGLNFAIFTSVLSGSNAEFPSHGFFNQDSFMQILRFASITMLALHRILRPANRIDPMRTILELEVVSVCWDAIDGSTLYELLQSSKDYSSDLKHALSTLMAFWYFSVGVRMCIMLLTHLSPTSWVHRRLVAAPLQLDAQPTIDRTLQGLRLRSFVVMVMAVADFFAAAIRIYLWSEGKLDALQQDMAVKNFVFLVTFSSAFYMCGYTVTRNWNSREVLTYPVKLYYPSRETQFVCLRYLFIASYLSISIALTCMLAEVTGNNHWFANIVFDVIFCLGFYIYARNINRKEDYRDPTDTWLRPRQGFFAFPARTGLVMGSLLALSLFAFRIPGVFLSYVYIEDDKEFSYDNAMLLVVLMILPIGFYATYYSIGYLLFRKEFTASPDNYHAIHDPMINVVITFTMTEGALDVLSCATLMQLATNDLPPHVNNAIILVCILEMVNACQSFALQCTLSGGHDDTPLDLVKWTAYARLLRAVIDAIAMILRLVLWIQFGAVSSVFLVKNLYNLIHTLMQIERYTGVKRYPRETLFTELVVPQDWYNMTKEEWRKATETKVT